MPTRDGIRPDIKFIIRLAGYPVGQISTPDIRLFQIIMHCFDTMICWICYLAGYLVGRIYGRISGQISNSSNYFIKVVFIIWKSRISGVDIRPTGYPASRISGRIVNLISGRIPDIKKSRISGVTRYPVHPYLKSNCLEINVFKMFKI